MQPYNIVTTEPVFVNQTDLLCLHEQTHQALGLSTFFLHS